MLTACALPQIAKLPRIKKICVYCILWLFMAHISACGFWGLGHAEFNREAARQRGVNIWPLNVKGQPVTPESGMATQYFTAFYWSVTTLVKVPWVLPLTVYEQMYTSLLILLGTFTFSVIIGQITMQIKALDMARQVHTHA